MAEVLRYAAFTDTPDGGNPAGIVLDATGMTDDEMQAVAAEVGYSETAFLEQAHGELGGPGIFTVRYFSPEAEVPFCGHATIASAVALVDHGVLGPFTFRTASGDVPVIVDDSRDDRPPTASLTSVVPEVRDLDPGDLTELLAALDWSADDLDPTLPPKLAYAGAWHPVLAAATHERLSQLEYDFDRLQALMAARSWTTVQLIFDDEPPSSLFQSRNPFPPGGVVEDPATGAAAAALGAYLRDVGRLDLRHGRAPVEVRQGYHMGRPSLLEVLVRADDPRIRVSGQAVPIPA